VELWPKTHDERARVASTKSSPAAKRFHTMAAPTQGFSTAFDLKIVEILCGLRPCDD
jgi:hypothetical protein